MKNTSASHRFIIVHAGGKAGFINGAKLMFKARSETGDYNGQMNGENFQRWIQEKLLPNISENTIIIMDNAPYHSVQINKPPSKYTTKPKMIEWLTKNNIPFAESMLRYELYELIENNKSKGKTYKIDEILKAHGPTMLRLPPYMCELNPIELIWAQVKRKVRENNPSTLTSAQLYKLTDDAINSISPEDWVKCCEHVEKLEKQYWEKDNLLDSMMAELTIEDSNSETESSSGSSLSEDME
ncbi:uncharacterized protein LOC143342022 [Colletes latitarsis]|uniref:uncharacterized protein LOC143342022 n=1 Tax=Colletes latitarsis TaxID=2605962 RepID=UPI004035FC60